MMKKMMLLLLLFVTACTVDVPPTATIAPTMTPSPPPEPTATAQTQTAVPPQTPINYSYTIVNSYPHDVGAFTQGLIWHDGIMYESTGQRGESDVRRVLLESGEVMEEVPIDDQYFGEGITIFDDKLYQLTWQAGTGFVYDADSLELLDSFTYPTEGWGMTHDGEQLIMSDGTNTIYFWDVETLEENGRLQVHDGDTPIARLNELEYIDGEIYANIWQTNLIARIDSETGAVVGWIDLRGLLSAEEMAGLSNPGNAVLNGIAYDAENGRLFVTGKLWPTLFEIELHPQ